METNYSDSILQTDVNARVTFIKKTYQHLAFAILAFIGLEALLLNSPIAPLMVSFVGAGKFNWLIILGLFMFISWIADNWARSSTSRKTQYIGLTVYVVAEALIFVPLLFIAKLYAPNVIPLAGIYTLLLFIGLTFTAFTTKKDFSFLGSILKIGGFIALGLIVTSIFFGFSLGLFFSFFMIIFAAGCILYDTSNILRHYHPEQYVAASLSLFASVALLFWYILLFLMQLASND